MSRQASTTPPDDGDVTAILADIAERSQKLVEGFIERQKLDATPQRRLDPLGLGSAMLELSTRLWTQPAEMMNAQFTLWQDYMRLWNRTTHRLLGGSEEEAVVLPERGDHLEPGEVDERGDHGERQHVGGDAEQPVRGDEP